MTIVIALLSIIALTEVTRLWLTHRPISKKRHFQQKLEGTEKMIYDLEFKAFKTREIREDIRVEYDTMAARISNFENQLKNWPADKDEAEKKRLEDQKVLAERDRDRFQLQMRELDVEVNGAKRSQEYPDGAVGILQQIESLRELQEMLREHIRSL